MGTAELKRKLGRTGVSVHPIGLGAWQLSNTGRPADADGVALIKAAIEAGVELIDTADSYCLDDSEFGHNERLVRRGLEAAGGAKAIVATKVGNRRPSGAWLPDGRPERIKSGCDASLARLGVESIFLYQLHQPDPQVPIEDTLGAMHELRAAGKIQHIGLSNVDEELLTRALDVTRIETVQNACNPWRNDDVTSGLIGYCAKHEIGYLPYYPVGGRHQHATLARKGILSEFAARYHTSTYCILLNWLLGLGEHVIPIPGATRVASITDSLTAASFRMDAAEHERLSAAAR